MRHTAIKTLMALAEQDERVLLLTGDLGYSVLEPFAQKYPEQFFNVGVAEQNMMGLATGLAEAGFIPFVYSIATFASLRPFEFIRNGPVLHSLPVRILGVGGGFEYGHAGVTHFANEDIGAMRLLPGMTIIAPADFEQTQTALTKTWDSPRPIYFRIGKDEKSVVPGLNGRFELGQVQIVRRGSDLLLLAMGTSALEAVRAAEVLERKNISSTVAVVACVSPVPEKDLVDLLSQFKSAITVETHYRVGGLGSLVSEIVAHHNLRCQVRRLGINSAIDPFIGSQAYMEGLHSLSNQSIADVASHLL